MQNNDESNYNLGGLVKLMTNLNPTQINSYLILFFKIWIVELYNSKFIYKYFSINLYQNLYGKWNFYNLIFFLIFLKYYYFI